jgi:hypothetical protein
LNEETIVYAADLSNLVWRRSSRSNGSGNQCVEVAFVLEATALRDSKNPTGGVLILPPAGWHTFRAAITTG